MIDLGKDKQQMLYWDEVDKPGYGINIDPMPHHRDFKTCWKLLNQLALLALPDDGEEVKEKINIPPNWYLKRPLQSK
jgi:hypothetical protein